MKIEKFKKNTTSLAKRNPVPSGVYPVLSEVYPALSLRSRGSRGGRELHLERSEIPMKRSESGTASQTHASVSSLSLVVFIAKCFLTVSSNFPLLPQISQVSPLFSRSSTFLIGDSALACSFCSTINSS